MEKMKADNKMILKPNTKAEERKMDWELTSVSHGSHEDSHSSHDDSHGSLDDSHDSLARCLSRPDISKQTVIKAVAEVI